MAVFGITNQRYKLAPQGFRREFAKATADKIMATYDSSVETYLKHLSSKQKAATLATDYLIARAFEYEGTGDDTLLLPMQMLRECLEDFGRFYREEAFASRELSRCDKTTVSLKRLTSLG